eukprot:gene12431-biopygen6445
MGYVPRAMRFVPREGICSAGSSTGPTGNSTGTTGSASGRSTGNRGCHPSPWSIAPCVPGGSCVSRNPRAPFRMGLFPLREGARPGLPGTPGGQAAARWRCAAAGGGGRQPGGSGGRRRQRVVAAAAAAGFAAGSNKKWEM